MEVMGGCFLEAKHCKDNYCIFLLWLIFFFFSSRRRHTRSLRDWSSDVCSSDLWHSRTNTGTCSEPNRRLLRFFLRDLGGGLCSRISQPEAHLLFQFGGGRQLLLSQIGRASCRERVSTAVGAGASA